MKSTTNSAHEEFQKATAIVEPVLEPKPEAPHLPDPDSPQAIAAVDETADSSAPAPKPKENNEAKLPDMMDDDSPDLWKWALGLAVAALIAFVGYNSQKNDDSFPSKVVETVVKTEPKEVVKWKTKWRTKWKTKTKTVYKDKIIEKPVVKEKIVYKKDIREKRRYEREIQRLKHELARSQADPYKLHKKAIKGYFRAVEDGRRGSLEVRHRDAVYRNSQ